uniref:cellulase n=1 Tax=Anthurium amnicola TaxID=1678845 RepID=A0A1D1YL32_9ARAE
MEGEFGWDSKHAGIFVLIFPDLLKAGSSGQLLGRADEFVCTVLPESPDRNVKYSPGGLLFKVGGANMQHSTSLSFLLAVHARQLTRLNRVVHCGRQVVGPPARHVQVAKSQADYILGDKPAGHVLHGGLRRQVPTEAAPRPHPLQGRDTLLPQRPSQPQPARRCPRRRARYIRCIPRFPAGRSPGNLSRLHTLTHL